MKSLFGREVQLPDKHDVLQMSWVYPLALLLAFALLVLIGEGMAHATWVPTGTEDAKTMAWFQDQVIMPEARKRLLKDYGISWLKCCGYADHVRVKFEARDEEQWATPLDGAPPFLLPADTIHPSDETMPQQLAVEGVVMVVKQGAHGNTMDIVTCVWLPQSGG